MEPPGSTTAFLQGCRIHIKANVNVIFPVPGLYPPLTQKHTLEEDDPLNLVTYNYIALLRLAGLCNVLNFDSILQTYSIILRQTWQQHDFAVQLLPLLGNLNTHHTRFLQEIKKKHLKCGKMLGQHKGKKYRNKLKGRMVT